MWHLLALPLVALITWFLYRMWSFRKRVDVFPGPPTLPIIGNAHQIGRNGIEFMINMRKLCEQYGPNFRMFIGPFNATIILTDPRDIEILLKNNKWLKKSVNYTFIEPWLGQGLVTSSGERWRRNRKIITPTFHFKILEQFVPVFNTEADTLIEKLEKNVDGPAFDMNPYINLFALDVICETSMGTTVGAQHDAGGAYVLAVKDLCGVVPVRTFSPFLRYYSIFKMHPLYQTQVKALKVVHSFVDRVIAKRRKLLADTGSGGEKSPVSEEDDSIGKKKKVVFLDLLLQSTDDLGSPLPDSIIKDEVHTFMFAGHDTTTGAMSFTLYLLSRHSEIQDKVFQEQRDFLGDDLKNNPTYSDLQEMNYLTMVIKEALRIYCSIPAYSREMTEDGDFRGKIVPAGVTISVNAFLCHRNPEHWPEPNKFDPDRFTPEETAKRHPFAYVPFSAGPRNCMGQKFAMLEMKSCISKVLRNFELLPFGKDEDLLLETSVVLKCKSGINMKIKKRKYT